MPTTVTLDNVGRITIPQDVRKSLHLDAGDALVLESEGERIILRRADTPGSMQQERGVWVFRTGQPLAARTAEATLDRIRQERATPDQSGTP
jgi:AbrB family looped-hinge helix DNA binding protein